jgi:hypothetical protein
MLILCVVNALAAAAQATSSKNDLFRLWEVFID